MPDDYLDDYATFEALSVGAGDHLICPVCDIGILINVDPEPNRLLCDTAMMPKIIAIGPRMTPHKSSPTIPHTKLAVASPLEPLRLDDGAAVHFSIAGALAGWVTDNVVVVDSDASRFSD